MAAAQSCTRVSASFPGGSTTTGRCMERVCFCDRSFGSVLHALYQVVSENAVVLVTVRDCFEKDRCSGAQFYFIKGGAVWRR